MERTTPTFEDDSSALTLAALGPEGSVTRMLRVVADRLASMGGVLWELAPGHDLQACPPRGQLFTLATVFDTPDTFAVDSLDLESATGAAFLEDKVRAYDDLRSQGGSGKNHPYILRHRIQRMCTAPIRFLGGVERGALNVYRRDTDPEFDTNDQRRLEGMAKLVPSLFRAAREREGLALVNDLNAIARGPGGPDALAALSKPEQRDRLLAMCRRISDTLNCHEVTVLLEDWLEPQHEYECQATTVDWKWTKRSYSPKDEGRLTGWALKYRKAVVIRDLRHLARPAERDALLREYQSLPVHEPRQDAELAKRVLGITDEAELPPLTYMIAPIMAGSRLLGAIRCHLARTASFYFSPRDLELLKIVGAQIGHFWHVWLTNLTRERERELWQGVAVELGRLNDDVSLLLRRGDGGSPQQEILDKALLLCGKVLPGADINTVRLVNEAGTEMSFGALVRRGTAGASDFAVSDPRDLPPQRFTIGGPTTCAGQVCFASGTPYLMANTAADPYYHEVFPGVTAMLIAPISVGNHRFGLLDLRWVGGNPIPEHADEAARLIGCQMGLYLELVSHVQSLREAQAKALEAGEAAVDQERKVRQNLEDFAHQLKGPLILAQRRARQTLDLAGPNTDTTRPRETLGLIRKAYRVSSTMRILAELSSQRKLTCSPTQLEADPFLRLLTETALDTEARLDPRRRFRFQIDSSSIRSALRRKVQVDHDLLEQIVGNLFDNAAKYSYPDTAAKVYAGISKGGQFYLAVANKGIPLSDKDQRQCLERGYRSAEARDVTGEGSGIGLYIVDQIAQAHHGRVEVNRRTPDEMTEFRVYLPVLP